MLILIISLVIFSVAALTAAIIFAVTQRQRLAVQPHDEPTRPTPTITNDGQILETVDDFNQYLKNLNNQLQEKLATLAKMKVRYKLSEDYVSKLTRTKDDVQNFYKRLQIEIDHKECECRKLQAQINDFINRRDGLKRAVTAARTSGDEGATENLRNQVTETTQTSTLTLPESIDRRETTEQITYDDIRKWIVDFRTRNYQQNLKSMPANNSSNNTNKLNDVNDDLELPLLTKEATHRCEL